MSQLNIHAVIIDPQDDFMGHADGSPLQFSNGGVATLPVPGAIDDMKRLASLIDRIGPKLNDIHVTLDSHRVIDVAHPGMWRDADGNHPAPFTIITADDIRNGIWQPRVPALRAKLLAYAETLEAQGNYPLMIWPEHCLIGTEGHNIQTDLSQSLKNWERRRFANVNFVTKGTNTFTEHYGALKAEVEDPNDPSTQLNTGFLNMLADADIVVVAGEASSHCVLSTVNQIADNIGEDQIKKFHLLTDCMSPVAQKPGGPDFPAIADAWLKDMESKGMTLTTSEKFLN